MSTTFYVFVGETQIDSFDVASNSDCGSFDHFNKFVASLPVSFRKHIDAINEYSLEAMLEDMPYNYQPKPLTATQQKVIARYEDFMGMEEDEDNYAEEDAKELCLCCNTKQELYGVPSRFINKPKYACFSCIQNFTLVK